MYIQDFSFISHNMKLCMFLALKHLSFNLYKSFKNNKVPLKFKCNFENIYNLISKVKRCYIIDDSFSECTPNSTAIL